MLSTPIIIVNYKTYKESYGKNALNLTKILEENAISLKKNLAVAVCPPDIRYIAENVKIPVLSQHVDPISFGSYTGYLLPENLKEAGAYGSLINHSEHRMKIADIDACIQRLKELGMCSVVCTNNVSTSSAIAVLDPDFLAVEPPELIGGDIAVSKARPEVVSGSVNAVKKLNKKVKVLCGAGVKTGEDVSKAIELGADGVLLASGVVKAKDIKSTIIDLLKGLG
ncbi:MAG: triose-phosphate isomerase [Candidatus Thermoplasmatota archaeon]